MHAYIVYVYVLAVIAKKQDILFINCLIIKKISYFYVVLVSRLWVCVCVYV